MAVTLRDKVLPAPVLQGGAGVGVSLDRLAGPAGACGANAGDVDSLSSVREQIEQIMTEWRDAA